MDDVVAIKLTGLSGHAAWEVGKADDRNPSIGDYFTRTGQFAVPALFSGEIHDDASRPHQSCRFGKDQFRSRFTGDKRRGDDDIDVACLLLK